jgi:murein DD-endopeptidase MepM/ murein hydrolase activator NlpD
MRPHRIRLFIALAALAFGAVWAPSPGVALAAPEPPVTSANDDESAIWSWPVRPRPEVTRLFELEHRYSAGHRGIEVFAPDDGTVHFVGWVVDRPLVSVQHANGIRSTFEPVDAVVAEGEVVTRGQLIGHVAESPAHEPSGGLHLGARLGDDYLDPLALLGEVPRAILLPISP